MHPYKNLLPVLHDRVVVIRNIVVYSVELGKIYSFP